MTEPTSPTTDPPGADLTKAALLDAFAEGGATFARAIGLEPNPDVEAAAMRIVATVDRVIAGPVAVARAARAPIEPTVRQTTAVLDRFFTNPSARRNASPRASPKRRPRLTFSPENTAMAEPTTVTLTHPIKRDGATISSLEVRRPRVGDLRFLDTLPPGSSMLARELAMMARLTGLPGPVLDEIDAVDYGRLTEAAAFFSEEAPPAGSPTPPSSPV